MKKFQTKEEYLRWKQDITRGDTTTNVSESKNSRPKLIILLSGILLAVTISFFIYPHIKNRMILSSIRSRHASYAKAIDSLDYGGSYLFLSKFSKKAFSLKDWEKKVFKIAEKMDDEIYNVLLAPGNLKARVDIKQYRKATETMSDYSQTWLFENDDWFRAYAEDNDISGQGMIEEVIGTEEAEESEKVDITFELIDPRLTWYEGRSSIQKETLYQPQLVFRIKNTGQTGIKWLKVMAVFYKAGSKEIYDQDDAYVSTGLPLKPGYTSELIFLRSSIGFVLNDRPPMESLLLQLKVSSEYDLDIEIYYQTEDSKEWKLFRKL